ncbi:hypothetical protein AB0L50_04245 [Streptomyces flaveolus]|uniref:hypothetical protein n=1 Tax=Streptomyces flaveolus TaxID=67297 RepID=UPI00342A81D8
MSSSEDFGAFGTALGAPSVYWTFGGLGPGAFAGADLLTDGIPPEIPHNRSPLLAPVPEPTLEPGVRCLLPAATSWLGPDRK